MAEAPCCIAFRGSFKATEGPGVGQARTSESRPRATMRPCRAARHAATTAGGPPHERPTARPARTSTSEVPSPTSCCGARMSAVAPSRCISGPPLRTTVPARCWRASTNSRSRPSWWCTGRPSRRTRCSSGAAARTALVTTEGMRDLLVIGRQTRPDIYDLEPVTPEPLVPDELSFELHARLRPDGSVELAPDHSEVRSLIQRAEELGAEALAVSLLYSYLNPTFEQLFDQAATATDLYVSLSSQVSPEYREVERTSTTALNAYVGPVMSRYLERLQGGLDQRGAGPLRIVQSDGGSASTERATRLPVATLLSGPAAGVSGAFAIAPPRGLRAHPQLRHGGHIDRRGTLRRLRSVARRAGDRRLARPHARRRRAHRRRRRRLDRAHRRRRRAARGAAVGRRRSGTGLLRRRTRLHRNRRAGGAGKARRRRPARRRDAAR